MNNQELLQLFKDINKYSNCFDRELALKKMKKQYKKSQFYKQTRYSIHKAYILFCANGFNTLSALLNSTIVSDLVRSDTADLQARLETFIEGIDLSVFDSLLDKIGEKIMGMELNTDQLQTNFIDAYKEFQNSIK